MPTKAANAPPRGALDVVVLRLRGTVDGLLAKDAMEMLAKRCVRLCAKHSEGEVNERDLTATDTGHSHTRCGQEVQHGKCSYTVVVFGDAKSNRTAHFRIVIYTGAHKIVDADKIPDYERLIDNNKALTVFFSICNTKVPKESEVFSMFNTRKKTIMPFVPYEVWEAMEDEKNRLAATNPPGLETQPKTTQVPADIGESFVRGVDHMINTLSESHA